jgi:hypothetical protein
MLLNGNDLALLQYDGHQKFFAKGILEKRYAARIRLLHSPRYLRGSFRTATQADTYGRQVVERYQRLAEIRNRQPAELVEQRSCWSRIVRWITRICAVLRHVTAYRSDPK